MADTIPGIHHVTAIAGDPRQNVDFYTGVLGLRLVKRTVNHDDPHTYHLYYGDHEGAPGTTLTFFPWPDGRDAEPGNGMADAVAFIIPDDSVDYWRDRLDAHDIGYVESERFSETVLTFDDPDGLTLELVATDDDPGTRYWPDSPVPQEHTIAGFHGVTLTLEETAATTNLLTDMGYERAGAAGDRERYVSDGDRGYAIDIRCTPNRARGRTGVGSIHHVAHRTPDQETQRAWRERLIQDGFNVTPVIDRWYFHSIYFREPGGVLFEIATEEPGFTRDEPLEALGERLVLPDWLTDRQDEIEAALPPLGDADG